VFWVAAFLLLAFMAFADLVVALVRGALGLPT
jgi:hypothetical protein